MARKYRPLRQFKPTQGKAGKDKAAMGYRAELQIHDLSDDGRGVARRGDKVVFVSGALPGEAVLAEVDRCHRRYDEGRAQEVRVAAAERVEPPCQYFGRCGGCQLQHLDYSAQLDFKQQRLSALLQRLGCAVSLAAPLRGEPWHYRHRGRFAFVLRGEQLLVGFRQAASHKIVPIKACPLLEDPINEALVAIVDAMGGLLRAAAGGDLTVVRDSRGQLAVAVDATRRPSPALCAEAAQALAEVAQLVVVSHKGQTVWECLESKSLYYQQDGSGNSFRFSPLDFTQVNPTVNRLMVAQVLNWLEPQADDTVADFFAGLGNFSLPTARHCRQVRGYELDGAMVARALDNAKAAGVDNLAVCSADLFAPAAALVDGLDKAILDPPRAGAQALCELLAGSSVQRIAYVSCDPATLERDLALLLAGGYRIEQACVADMFPHSHHMESLVLLRSG